MYNGSAFCLNQWDVDCDVAAAQHLSMVFNPVKTPAGQVCTPGCQSSAITNVRKFLWLPSILASYVLLKRQLTSPYAFPLFFFPYYCRIKIENLEL